MFFAILKVGPAKTSAWAVVLLAAALLLMTAAWRGAEYDEGYTLFLTAGTARPAWPATPFTAAEALKTLSGASTAGRIAADLRATDVHPPLYFWAVAVWRDIAGTSLFAIRGFSVACSLGALLLVAAIARRAAIPPVAAMLLTLGCYGFCYSGIIARGFALAQFFSLAGVLFLLVADRRANRWVALLAGFSLGAASFSNYLASFVAAAGLLWFGGRRRHTPGVWLPAVLGFSAFMPADLWFFLAQHASRADQFPPFTLLASLGRLGHYAAGSIMGGLPLYAGALFGPATLVAVAAALSVLLVSLTGLIVWYWRKIAKPGPRALLGLCALAPPVGLLALGAVFNTTPIELRYLAFATPFIGFLLAGLAAALPARAGVFLLCVLLPLQALAIAGLMTRPETMQPQAAAAHEAASLMGASGISFVPRGNDGVGVVGAFLLESPPGQRVQVVPPDATAAALRAWARPFPRVAMVLLALDADSRAAVETMRTALAEDPCWRATGSGFNLRGYERVCPGE